MAKKSTKANKRRKKASTVKDLPAKSASPVKGGVTSDISLNFTKIKYEY